MYPLAGRNALVTGASHGIGAHVARRLAAEGMNVAIAARSVDQLEQVRVDLARHDVTAVAIRCDVTDPAQRDALIARAEYDLGGVDVLVNNAGIEAFHHYDRYPPEEIRQLVVTNLLAPMLLTRAALPGMLRRGRGHVVSISSIAGKGPAPYQVPYSTTKYALVGMTQALRTEYAGTDVGFSVICPGFVTGEGMYVRMREHGLRIPRRMGRARIFEVADAVVDAIVHDKPEIIVNSTPLRPALALAELFPRLPARAVGWFGVTRAARAVADREDDVAGRSRD